MKKKGVHWPYWLAAALLVLAVCGGLSVLGRWIRGADGFGNTQEVTVVQYEMLEEKDRTG